MQRFREPVSGFLHLGGLVLALIGSIGLVSATWQSPAKMVSLVIYGGSLILMFAASTALHLTRGSPRTLLWLNRLDHAAIYVVIAGTYTPFCFNLLSGAMRWEILLLIWTLALAGTIYKLFFNFQPRHFSTLLYLGMGWFGGIGLMGLRTSLPSGLIGLVLIGGSVYSLGAVIFAFKKPNIHRYLDHHDLWHIFVLAGSFLEFLAVVRYVV
jgi:hemolysin III